MRTMTELPRFLVEYLCHSMIPTGLLAVYKSVCKSGLVT